MGRTRFPWRLKVCVPNHEPNRSLSCIHNAKMARLPRNLQRESESVRVGQTFEKSKITPNHEPSSPTARAGFQPGAPTRSKSTVFTAVFAPLKPSTLNLKPFPYKPGFYWLFVCLSEFCPAPADGLMADWKK